MTMPAPDPRSLSPIEKRAELFAPDPLRDERLERFARLRVIGVPKEAAAERAGFRTRDGRPLRRGNIARIDRRPDVRARIAYLAQDDVEVIKEVRQFVRERLMTAANFDVLKQFGIVEMYERGGKNIGKLVGIDWEALQKSEFSIAITGFKFDAKTGRLVDFDRDDPLNAVAQLRDMHGLRASVKAEISGRDGGPILTAEVTDDDRKKALASLFAKFKAKHEAVPLVESDKTAQAGEVKAKETHPIHDAGDYSDDWGDDDN
jgi:hypothetical protein